MTVIRKCLWRSESRENHLVHHQQRKVVKKESKVLDSLETGMKNQCVRC